MKSDLEISLDNEVLDSLSKETPQTPAACQGETDESLTNQDKAWKGPVVSSKESVTDRDPAVKKDQRLQGLESEKSSDHQITKAGYTHPLPPTDISCRLYCMCLSRPLFQPCHDTFNYITGQLYATLHDGLSDDVCTAKKEASFPETEIMDSENMFFSGENAGLKRTPPPLFKHYNSGQTFHVIFPDGTGQVYYLSGRLAILVTAAQSADWSCVVVLEDKQQPRILAVFTTTGQATCYHNNGCIWVNLTLWGGTYCSDTGDLKKQWSWLDNKHHVHAPPYQPLCLTLSPNLNIRIKSQEHICITFTSGNHSSHLNVGAKVKLNQGKGLTLPGPDMLQRYLQQKSAEINVLLQNIQSLITYQKTVSPQKVKPQQSLISQMERRRLPMKQQQSAKKTP
ncbi:glutamate-rich protein 6-like isoform X1 [Seriola aureovittata]|uniref:glutamate-rich protein 6-like isoform X1 n=1 Tax=Seriola aureovittata TaxID=2871759 RepID=UPI0024BDCC92|nr:glutamate-rich protein 6-like isoform X1 [Seriola aureovittata]